MERERDGSTGGRGQLHSSGVDSGPLSPFAGVTRASRVCLGADQIAERASMQLNLERAHARCISRAGAAFQVLAHPIRLSKLPFMCHTAGSLMALLILLNCPAGSVLDVSFAVDTPSASVHTGYMPGSVLVSLPRYP